jgi:hypothetical protein
MTICDYGCGQEAKYQFKNGKWCCSKNTNYCPQIKKKHQEAVKKALKKPEEKERRRYQLITNNPMKRPEIVAKFIGSNNPSKRLEVRKKISENNSMKRMEIREIVSICSKKFHNLPEVKEKQRQYMLSGGAVTALRGNKNPSIPQVSIYNNVKGLYPNDTSMNYSVYIERGKWYSLDIVIESLKINIEYDEPYWHRDLEKDRKRDEDLKKTNWKILRYRGYVPSIEQLKEDIFRTLKGG